MALTEGIERRVAPCRSGDHPPERLRVGGTLSCARCYVRLPDWQYKRVQQNPRYRDQTAEIVKCPVCSFLFAPLPDG